MKLGIWTVRKEALPLGRHLKAALGGKLYAPVTGKRSNQELFRARFSHHDHWILIMATGIAVRYLSGLPKSKYTDPAVVILDASGRFVISLLSGHEGGANALAYAVARVTGGIPVVTTATEALKPLVVGIGCRKDATCKQIDRAVQLALDKKNRLMTEIREIATVDIKAKEPGLLQWCAEHGLPLRIIRREIIEARPWVSQKSAWVQKTLGVAGVCEPCALIAAPRGRLLVPKINCDGVSVSVVEDAF